MAASDHLKFRSWQRSPLYDLVPTDARTDGRLLGKLPLTLRDGYGPDVATGTVDFHIVAPRDIAGLVPRAIVRTVPAALARDVEATNLVHVDFADPDLPWRYTPRKANGDQLLPWLTLLVGSASELRIEGTTARVLEPNLLTAYDLSRSYRWAHVQEDTLTNARTSRLLSPRELQPRTEYLAALVPTFDDAGELAWAPDRGPAALTVLHSWRFWTGEAGDFETLAFAIVPVQVPGLGRAPVAYRRGPIAADLEIRGAITSLGGPPDGEAVAAARADLQAFKADVDGLAAVDPLVRKVIGLPSYGRRWVEQGVAAPPWIDSLDQDPRHRGTAGVGAWMGIRDQRALVDAAVQQLGALRLAAHLVGELAFGIQAARSLWTRRLPAEPSRRVHIFSPLMRRMRATAGTALAAITGPTSPLEAALFSSAARRSLRRGAAWTRHTQRGFVGRGEFVDVANRCPPEPRNTLAGLPHVDDLVRALGLPSVKSLDDLDLHPVPPIDDRSVDVGDLRRFVGGLLPEPPRSRCEPHDLERVAAVVAEALDPHGAKPPAWRRVQSRISGIDIGTLEPPEVPVGLDFPTWTMLRDRAKEWLLPGVDQLPKHSVVAMQTNPTFIDAYLAGLNEQLLDELHWRNVPVDRRSTPLLMFWGHVNFETGQREAEIQPFTKWGPQTDLGAKQHQVLHPGDATGKQDLVIVFRSDLFWRYPATLVYLVKRRSPPPVDYDDDLKATPVFEFTAAVRADRMFLGPIFQGALARDVVFFAFDVDPQDLDQYWLVLDEPPSELRFRARDAMTGAVLGTTAPHGAAFARTTIDRKTRVAIDGPYLEQLGLRL